MAQDSFVINGVCRELNARITGGRINKIYMPKPDSVVMSLRTDEGNVSLLLEAGSVGRVHLSKNRMENPESPPMLCMLLRKHLSSGRIMSVEQPDFERMLVISIISADEMGEMSEKKLIIEMMGRRNNIAFVGSDGRIIGCLKRVDFEMSETHPVLPGLMFTMPPKQDKLQFLTASESELRETFAVDVPHTAKSVCDKLAGVSPLVSREIVACAQGGDVVREILSLRDDVTGGKLAPHMLMRDGAPFEFSAMKIEQYDDVQCEKYSDFSTLLDDFYMEKSQAEKNKNISSELQKTVKNAYDRQVRKLAAQEIEIESAQKREDMKRNADLIMANIHNIKNGEPNVLVTDYYNESMPQVSITLNPLKTPQQNATHMYHTYGRLKNAENMLSTQIAAGKEELLYLESVLQNIEDIADSRDVLAIREELIEGGYIKNKTKGKKNQKKVAFAPRKYKTTDGFSVLCGRNNVENDTLSMKYAHHKDLWFHARNVPGSHVILELDGKEPTDEAITEAAAVAAYFSKLGKQPLAAIDYTVAKYVKKISGAKPGMVTYSNFKTAFVKPMEL